LGEKSCPNNVLHKKHPYNFFVQKKLLVLKKLTTGLNFINIILVQKLQWIYAEVSGAQRRTFLVVCNGKVGCNFVGETEEHRRMTASAKE
jgi:hypothetical protein